MTHALPLETILARADRAFAKRRSWEGLWKDCYDHALPARPGDGGVPLYDGTAPDAVEQLAASLLAELTPPWTRWFSFVPGRALPATLARDAAARTLETAAETLAGEFERSNFVVELHQ
ncbi:MAG: portal protein, partial [Elioraea sp.]|nr:portal protein [Elioraea sp.]